MMIVVLNMMAHVERFSIQTNDCRRMKRLILLFMTVFFMACSSDQAIKDPIQHFSHAKQISSSVYNKIDLEQFGVLKPWECIKAKGKYYIFENKKSHVFSSINPADGCAYQGIDIGDGPEDVHFPERFVIEDGDVTFYDGSTMRRYKLIENQDSTLRAEEYRDIGIEAISYPAFHGEKMVAKGWSGDAWLYYYSGKAKIGTFDYPSFPETDRLSGLEKMSVFRNGQQKFSPDGSKIVATIDSGCALAIINCTDTGLDKVAMLEYYPPMMVAIENEYQPFAISRNCKIGFVDVCCSNQFIFALYSGKIFGDDIFTSHYGGYVFVYDWEGNPVKYYKLEKDLFTLEIDEDNDILYGIGNDPDGCILEYKL